ncbi:MAG: hypothetical protein M3P34_05510, partial [Actinomycetota bacterium]|nr:hypothetical protein [Actinomycetota bacterium]
MPEPGGQGQGPDGLGRLYGDDRGAPRHLGAERSETSPTTSPAWGGTTAGDGLLSVFAPHANARLA